jgi:hypothetical protein
LFFKNAHDIDWAFDIRKLVMLDIPYVDAPLFVPPSGFKGHLFLRLGWGFGLIPSRDGTIFCHDAPACAWRQLYSLLE